MKELIDYLIDNINKISILKKHEKAIHGHYNISLGKENFSNLLQIALKSSETVSYIVESYRVLDKKNKRETLCELLHLLDNKDLIPFFKELLLDKNMEVRCCAIVALSRLEETEILDSYFKKEPEFHSTRYRFFKSLALIRIGCIDGIPLLIHIIEDESVASSLSSYASCGSLILNSLFAPKEFNVYKDSPYFWVDWWKNHEKSINSINVTEYTKVYLAYTPIWDMKELSEKIIKPKGSAR